MLGLLALAGHGLALVVDRTVRMPLAGLIVPGLSPYPPLAVGVGVLTAELMLAVYVSFALRKRIGTKNWRRLHWATYAIFAGATCTGSQPGRTAFSPGHGRSIWARRRRGLRHGLARHCRKRKPHTARHHDVYEEDSHMSTYRIEIDHSTCIGYAGCVKEAPDVFWIEDDVAFSRPETDDARVLEAAELCPVSAITVIRIEDEARAALTFDLEHAPRTPVGCSGGRRDRRQHRAALHRDGKP